MSSPVQLLIFCFSSGILSFDTGRCEVCYPDRRSVYDTLPQAHVTLPSSDSVFGRTVIVWTVHSHPSVC